MTSRKEKIEAMLEDDPHDTLLRYGLAMEYEKEGDHDESLRRLAELAGESPPYVPAFHMSAQQLIRLSRIDEARTMLRDGIEAARNENNMHAAGEMSELLASIGQFGE